MQIKSMIDIPAVASYLRRIGAEVRSMRTAVVKEVHGSYWSDIAIITINNDGKIKSPEAYAPTMSETLAIVESCKNIVWPHTVTISKAIVWPEEVTKANRQDVFEFRNLQGELTMLQLRIERKGEKSYVPFTYWNDGEWRQMEPEGKLPLWGLEQLSNHSVAFIHEGAKAARIVAEMIKGETKENQLKKANHPWHEELDNAAHLGWIGGALSPSRTDWEKLRTIGIKRVYIVSDNDAPGVAAVPQIAFNLHVPTFQIQFTSEWPGGFDFGDDFPKSMFKKMDEQKYYIGPSFRSCLHPATWATDLVANPKGKPTPVLRKNFKEMWNYVEEADLFVCVDMPDILRSEQVMNKMLASFSHTNLTSQLLVKHYTGRSVKLCYRPDVKGRLITDITTSAINLHTPTQIKSLVGDCKPWIDFLEYMFPNDHERKDVMRWAATLIAKVNIHMEYGLLLVSERQGVGKTTLGASILGPLVGIQNVGFPTEGQIVNSEFNGWLANKRLCVVNEIYSGHSWKAYNKLKSAITDREVEVNEKYQRSYVIENWCHVFACSNSMRALRMEQDDRRWFYPEVTEEKWPKAKFDFFHNWLRSGGLGIVRRWAEEFGNYVSKGEAAPMTDRKKDLIAGSMTEGQNEAAQLAAALARSSEPMALTMKDIVAWVRSSVQGRVYDSDLELRKAMKENGAIWFEERMVVFGRLQPICINRKAFDVSKAAHGLKLSRGVASFLEKDKKVDESELGGHKPFTQKADFRKEITTFIKSPNDLIKPAM